MNGFEIRPGGGGCGCGGCGGENETAHVHPLLGRALEKYELIENQVCSSSLCPERGMNWWEPFLIAGSMPGPNSEYWRELPRKASEEVNCV